MQEWIREEVSGETENREGRQRFGYDVKVKKINLETKLSYCKGKYHDKFLCFVNFITILCCQ